MKTEYIIIIILVIILFLVYKKEEHFMDNESVLNISKIYSDASGVVTFNNIRANRIKILDLSANNIDVNNINTNNINTKKFIGNNIKVNNISVNDVSANDISANDISIMNKLVFSTDKDNNKWEGIHTFWMQSGWDPHQVAMIRNPDGETYNADNWVCLLSNNYDYQNNHGHRTFIDTETNNWCVYKWIKLGQPAFVTVMCYPRQMFSKVWANKWKFTAVDHFNPSGSDWNNLI